MIQVYTGDGKGKTTAALGLALRAVGHGMRVRMIQFMKGGIDYGEIEAAKRWKPLMEIIPMGRPDFVDRENPDPVDMEWAQKGMALANRVIEECRDAVPISRDAPTDVLILDEVLVAVDYGLISLKDLLALMKKKPTHMELVLTGRDAPKEVIDRANLVTEMREVKHYYRRGIESRQGFDH